MFDSVCSCFFDGAIGADQPTDNLNRNVELCKRLGADEVIDYKKSSVVEALKSSGRLFDVLVDNVGGDTRMYFQAHTYTKPGAPYIMVGATPNLSSILSMTRMMLLPSFLGGGKRSVSILNARPKAPELEQIGKWMQNGQVEAVIDSEFPFEQLPRAFEKLKTGRAKGKIVVHVAPEAAKR